MTSRLRSGVTRFRRNSTLKNFLPMFGANAVTPLCSLLSGPILAYGLGPSGRGEYATLTVPVIFVGIASTLGFQDGITYAIARAGWSAQSMRRRIPFLGIGLSTVAVSLLLIVGLVVTKDSPELQLPFFLLALTAPIQVYTGLYAGLLVGAEDYSPVNRSKIIASVSRLLMLAALLPLDLLTSVVAASVHMLASAFGLLILVAKSGRTERSSESEKVGFSLTRYSLTAAPAIVVSLAALRLDQVIALPLIGTEQLGLYAAAVGLGEATVILATTARTMILGGSGERAATEQQRKLTIYALVGTGIIILSGMAIAGFVIRILLGPSFDGSYHAVLIVFAGNFSLAGCQLASGWLLRYGRAGWQSAAFGTGCLVNILVLFLLKDMGATGAAIASACNYTVAVTIMMIALYRHANQKVVCAKKDGTFK
ncbi:oligosaccharide flippase family protein [Rhodococcus fascians]|uniref:lipopolysaccharide biosynthesis protein n=1 Tax=Rhodococcoides fascians TaxID=1828 RepID=UPI0024B74519|nr:oligosaccharide flippase family protein [Rhodococcus fascians]MDJ0002922.1 oligosaccharide flippase family protein [Rhodococcus fascians]